MKLNFIKSNLQVVNITYGEIIKQNHTVSMEAGFKSRRHGPSAYILNMIISDLDI